MKGIECKLAWINTLSSRIFRTYEEAFVDAQSDLIFKSKRKSPSNELVCKYVKIVYLWI